MDQAKTLVPYFLNLSDELIIQILHFCAYIDILRFAATSQRHHAILSNSISLKFHIELEVNGLHVVEGSRKGEATYSRLLEELICYRDAWLNLELEDPIERISNREMLLWELREGNYVVAFTSESDAAWATDSWGPDSMQLTPIGSLETPQPVTFSTFYNELTLDFEQDLVALVKTNPDNKMSLEVRLCSTTTGLSHPLARNPVFFVQVGFRIPGPGHQTFTLEVIGDILVVRIAEILDYEYEIMAWNWKSGALLCRIGSISGIADFTLLDSTHLALFSVTTDEQGPRLIALSLYSMIPHTHDETATGPYFSAMEYESAQPSLVFEFPKLDDAYQVLSRVIMRSDPIPGRTTYTKSASFAHSTALTLSIIMSLSHFSSPDMDENSVHLRIFVEAKSLLSYLLEPTGHEDTVVIPWEVWGTRATRWFLCEKQTTYWVYWTSGSRFIRVNENAHSDLDDLSVFDFHPPIVKRTSPYSNRDSTEDQMPLYKEKMRENVLNGRGLLVPHPETLDPDTSVPPSLTHTVGSDMPTVIKTGFAVPIESCLSYRVVTKPSSVPHLEDWSIDGSHIIGMMTVSAYIHSGGDRELTGISIASASTVSSTIVYFMADGTYSPDLLGIFPDELIVRILHFCDFEDILQFATTNRRYYNVVVHTISLQLHVELEANCLEIIKGSQKNNATYSLLLDELARYRDAWLDLKFETPFQQFSEERALLWDFRGGYYAVGFTSASTTTSDADSLEIIPLDSSHARSKLTLPTDFHELTFDSDQDFLVLAKVDAFKINLCSITTGLAHPLAENPMFTVQVDFPIPDPKDEPQAFTMEVMDAILVVKITDPRARKYELIAWNWKTWEPLLRVGSISGAIDFSFLQKTHLVLFSAEEKGKDLRLIELLLYSISPQISKRRKTSTLFHASDYDHAVPVLILRFPEPEKSYTVMPTISFIKSNSTPGKTVYAKSAGFAHPSSPTLGVFLSLYKSPSLHADEETARFLIVISTRYILRYLIELPDQKRSSVIPWDEWGTNATRWFVSDDNIYQWAYWMSGTRLIRVHENPVSVLRDLSILDFNSRTIRRFGSSSSEKSFGIHQPPQSDDYLKLQVLAGKGLIRSLRTNHAYPNLPELSTEVVDSEMPTIIVNGFLNPVESRLPYRKVTRTNFLPRCEDWAIYGPYIIMINTMDHGHVGLETITTYKLQT
ncbi:A Receptor for Ubiquitination Targets, partial [Rhizoctonia solani]